jgi:hypothetical protein
MFVCRTSVRIDEYFVLIAAPAACASLLAGVFAPNQPRVGPKTAKFLEITFDVCSISFVLKENYF